jgi:methylase of polypeptide subunit release factors
LIFRNLSNISISLNVLLNAMQKSLETYQFKPYETIASIGASSGVWEIWFASQVDNLTFYLQDIDPLNCNQEEINYGVKYYEKLLNKPIIGQFIPIIGNHHQTNLPPKYFDKILIINSLHELLFVNKILQDIKNCLKSSGKLFIEEQIAKFSGEIHEGCGKALFMREELIDCLNRNGFELVKTVEKVEGVFIFEFNLL